RVVWVFPAAYLPRWLSRGLRQRDPSPPWQFPAVVSWAGLRGGESLVLAAAMPTLTAAGTPFPGRDLIIAITFAVILVTLLGQGFTLAPLLRWLNVRETGVEERREEIAARLRASKAALARLEELATAQWMHPETLAHTRDRYHHRTRRVQGEDVTEREGGTAPQQLLGQLLLARRHAQREPGDEAVEPRQLRGVAPPRRAAACGEHPRNEPARELIAIAGAPAGGHHRS